MARPDQSSYLAHFTKNGKDYDGSEGPHSDLSKMSALEKLISILEAKKYPHLNCLGRTKKQFVLRSVHGGVCLDMPNHIVHMALALQKN